ncbi:hypothetical protein GCM10018966_012890 [Streptomyces yanii]
MPSDSYQPIVAPTFGTVTHAIFPVAGQRDGDAEIVAPSGPRTAPRRRLVRELEPCRTSDSGEPCEIDPAEGGGIGVSRGSGQRGLSLQ